MINSDILEVVINYSKLWENSKFAEVISTVTIYVGMLFEYFCLSQLYDVIYNG